MPERAGPGRAIRILVAAYLIGCGVSAAAYLLLGFGLLGGLSVLPPRLDADASALTARFLDVLLVVLGLALAWKALDRPPARLLLVFIGVWAFPSFLLEGRLRHVWGGVNFGVGMAALVRFVQIFPRRLRREDVFAAFATDRGASVEKWYVRMRRWDPVSWLARGVARTVGPALPVRWREVATREMSVASLVSWGLPAPVVWATGAVVVLVWALGESLNSPVTLVGSWIGGCLAMGVPVFAWIGYEVGTPDERHRILWILQGALAWIALLLVGGSVMILAAISDLPAAVGTVTVPIAGLGGFGLLFLSLLAAVFYRGAVDPRLALEKTALFGLLGAVGVFLFGAVETLVTDAVAARVGLPSGSGAWVAGGAMALAFGPLYGWLGRRVESVLDDRLPEGARVAASSGGVTVVRSRLTAPAAAKGGGGPEGPDAEAARSGEEAATLATLLHGLARRAANRHGGRLVRAVDDAVLLEFERPEDGRRAARTLEDSLEVAAKALGLEGARLRTGVDAGSPPPAPDEEGPR